MKKLLIIIFGTVFIALIAVGSFWLGGRDKHNSAKNSTDTQSSAKTTPANQSTSPPATPQSIQPTGMKPDISHWDPAGFVNASYSRKLTDFTPWQDSPVQSTVKDFTGDGINDMFVWVKLPSTNGYSFAAVWTVGSDNQPKELWYVPNQQVYLHSTWSVDGTNLVETGKLNTPNGLSDETNTYHWQNNTFVTY